MTRILTLVLLFALLLSACGNQPAATSQTVQYPTQPINIMAPASPGGGWDSTARTMQAALAATTGQTVQVYNVSGAGGTIGLAQFVNEAKGKPHELMVGGLVMVGAIQTNKAPVNLSQVTPIALLTAEAEAIVVPADSKYQTLQALIADFKANPTAISWGGGSAGGTDHILVGLIAKAVGVAPNQVNYIAYSGGGEATAAILSGAVTAGASGVSEFAEQVAAGTMRMLAVSSEERIEGVNAPTLKEAGVDVALMNWRAVFGAPNLTAEQRAAVIATIEKMHASKEWQEALAKNGWRDFFRTGDEFSTFLQNEIKRIEGVLRDLGLVQ
ncbi:tripartite tricarboxylate transporter substrate binding protein [Chloroflexus sp.]|uniref:Bug family tripartite tricarboxylate transporter substrate binding protein n=1 Tax=Chloroflexus sp. TaxID=1904827 RepID=UPI002ACE73BB|nr:tripartite tricarboxylate transporter substrate binding protein [Chloroflexus sp.]